jgi:2-oxoglutarate dehydrogenase E1 component
MIVFTPKSLLRHPQAVSTLADCARPGFQRILPDRAAAKGIKRVLLCTGKVYYELSAHRQEQKRDDVAIVRLEQLYPLSVEQLEAALPLYPAGTPAFWVQEEPENMGAWRFLRERLGATLRGDLPLEPVCRPESASPATGSAGAHKLEQQQLVQRAFGDSPAPSATADSASVPLASSDSPCRPAPPTTPGPMACEDQRTEEK